jgi:hypothetical protein
LPHEIKGKVIIRSVPDAMVKEKVVAFVCSHDRRVAPGQVLARLNSLPLVLVGSIEATRGERLVAALNGLGADAVFAASAGQPPPVVSPRDDAPVTPPPVSIDQPLASGPVRATRKKPVSRDEAEKQRIARACRIALMYALLAFLVAMVSPLFYLFAVPLALYAAHRAAALLEVDLWLRSIYFVGVFVPVFNLLVLCLLLLQTHLSLRRWNTAPDEHPDELAPLRLAFRLSYAAFMVIFLVGTESGFLPASMHDLRETVERRLEKDVARSAKQFPRTVDKDLRIDRMSAGPDKRLTFHCTLLHYGARSLDAERFRTSISSSIVKEVCGSKEMKYYLNKDVIIAYAFNGNDAQPITSVDVTNVDCQR